MTVDRSRFVSLLALVTLALIASSCRPAAAPLPPTITPSPTAASQPASIPDGVYTIALYRLKLQSGEYTFLTEFGQEWESGSYSVEGNRIVFTDSSFAPECGPEDSPFSFTWSFDGKALTLSDPSDKGSSRPTIMLEAPWVLQGQAQ